MVSLEENVSVAHVFKASTAKDSWIDPQSPKKLGSHAGKGCFAGRTTIWTNQLGNV